MQEKTTKTISELTEDELCKLIEANLSAHFAPKEKRYVYGIAGIQRLINCSESKAKRLKKSGVIDDAIIQNGRKIIVDAEMALELMKVANNVGRKNTRNG